MKNAMILAIATVGLFVTSGTVLGTDPAHTDPECAKVLKAKAESDVSISTKDLAERLGMPVDHVNACLMKVRAFGPHSTPTAGK